MPTTRRPPPTSIKSDLELVVDLLVASGHGSQADAKAGTVLDNRVDARVAQRIAQKRRHVRAVVGVDQA